MAKLKQKGKAGAAKAYITRSAAVKKLQCSLADFRRLCILKGIFPREPRNRKKANKGSSAPTSFYYSKDIAYLAHEPVLKKLREHKAFAKKLARALGRGEWSSAKSLDENKPVYRLDHIIKERYPTFIDALRDVDDALCLVSLFSTLPAAQRIPTSLVSNCSRLTAEWQLYVMHTRALRKVFLSIKGVYFQAEVMDQTVTWLVPYQFTQNIPVEVDVRVMLTFLEFYQTLLGFVFFKLYSDCSLVYPPPMDANKDDAGAGVGAYSLQEANLKSVVTTGSKDITVNGKKVTAKDVRQTIKTISNSETTTATEPEAAPLRTEELIEEDFQTQPSTKNPSEAAALPTLNSLAALPSSGNTNLFAPYTFFLSRETPRPLFEFIVRSFGGRIGWPASSGSGSPIQETDDSITHVIIDRPVVEKPNETEEDKMRRKRRKFVQPQWVVDCINAGKILVEEPYLQGATLPPHLSPFGEERGAYQPLAHNVEDQAMEDQQESEGEEEEAEDIRDDESIEDDSKLPVEEKQSKSALKAAAAAPEDPALLRAAELAAEAAGVDYGTFQKEIAKVQKAKKSKATEDANENSGDEQDMNKMMMSRKKRKLYEKMKFGEKKRAVERSHLEQKRKDLVQEKRQKTKS